MKKVILLLLILIIANVSPSCWCPLPYICRGDTCPKKPPPPVNRTRRGTVRRLQTEVDRMRLQTHLEWKDEDCEACFGGEDNTQLNEKYCQEIEDRCFSDE